jgi:hypothetical protein
MNHLVLDGPDATTGAGGTLSLVTLAEFQAYINEDADAGPLDARQQTLIDSACYGAFSLMGGRFLLRPATEFDYVLSPFDAGNTLFLPQYPLGTISVLEIGYMSANGVWTSQRTVASGDYYADAESGRVYGAWPLGMHTVRVSWPGGYTSALVPADAKEAVMMWAAVKMQRVRRSRWDVKTLQAASEGYSYTDTDLPEVARATFQKYSLATASLT